MPARFIPTLAIAVCCGISAAAETAKLTAADYESREVHGWTVKVEKSLANHPLRVAALKLLETKLADLTDQLPAEALSKLKEVPIWLSRNVAAGACYHPSAGWLKNNDRVVEMARSIEIQNIDHFIDWAPTQPLMVLHELTHAWHDRVLPEGYANPQIQAAFEKAVASRKYEMVFHANGKQQRHYALTNAMEYFAECSEAYFGRNDFQPFDRAELKAFDPAGFEMVEAMWGVE